MDPRPQHNAQCARSAGAKGGDMLPLIVTGKDIFNLAQQHRNTNNWETGSHKTRKLPYSEGKCQANKETANRMGENLGLL